MDLKCLWDAVTHRVHPKGDLLIVLRKPESHLTGTFMNFDDEDEYDDEGRQVSESGGKGNTDDDDFAALPLSPDHNSLSVPGDPLNAAIFLVSGQAVANASALFKDWIEQLLPHKFGDSVDDGPTALRVYWSSSPCDVDSFAIMMNIVHNRIRLVPRKLEVFELARMALVVQSFGFHEAVEAYADSWIKKLPSTSVSEFRKETIYEDEKLVKLFMADLVAALVFTDKDKLKKLIQLWVDRGESTAKHPGRPLPTAIAEALSSARNMCAVQVAELYKHMKVSLVEENIGCSPCCKSMLHALREFADKFDMHFVTIPSYKNLRVGYIMNELCKVELSPTTFPLWDAVRYPIPCQRQDNNGYPCTLRKIFEEDIAFVQNYINNMVDKCLQECMQNGIGEDWKRVPF
ncbi:hypothetical protein CDD83_517 [Cordyceps sp. RAO-2017]|nr:hypothetical protein CDD83_517 [Cordyceps sp. RAO-2017]